MRKRYLALAILTIIVISTIGCGLKNFLPSKEVPPLEGYNTIVIAPFVFKKPSTTYKDLPTLISYGLGTKLSVKYQDKTWIYNQSQDLNPVTEKLRELKLSSSDVYNNPEAAMKLAEAFNADLVITGIMEEPKITKEESSKVRYDMSDVGATGAARYYTIYQSVILKTQIKILEAKKSEAIWDGGLMGYKKYETMYLTGNSPRYIEETTMLAEVRRDYIDKLVTKLYPTAAAPKQ